jgi:acetyltransferase-like isoleucine patch superfamily enzyme
MSSDSTTAVTPQQARLTSGAFSTYRAYVMGKAHLSCFFWYEVVTTLLSGLPGLLGYGLRAAFYPTLFQQCAGKIGIGKGTTVRCPHLIKLGRKVLLDDYAVLDIRGDGSIELGDQVVIGRFSSITAKEAPIRIAAGTNISSFCRIATQSGIDIGESVLIAAYSYIGPSNHQKIEGKSLISSPMENRGGVKIEDHVWIGAHTTILDGVTIGTGAIVGAHSFVTEDVPAHTTVVGIPARIVKTAPRYTDDV